MSAPSYIMERFEAIARNIEQAVTLEQMGGIEEWIKRCDDEYGTEWSELHPLITKLYDAKLKTMFKDFKELLPIDHSNDSISGSLGVPDDRMQFFSKLLINRFDTAATNNEIIKVSDMLQLIVDQSRSLPELVLGTMMLGTFKDALTVKLKVLDINGPIDDAVINMLLRPEE